jgi:hypothetical protein
MTDCFVCESKDALAAISIKTPTKEKTRFFCAEHYNSVAEKMNAILDAMREDHDNAKP